MLLRLKTGWKTAQRHPWIITMLFIYELAWGFVLYKFLQSLIVPLLYRFPAAHSDTAVQVYMAEAQFQLLKTNIAYTPLIILALIVVARMLLTPFLNAGIYYSIDRDEVKQIRPFMTGVKKLGYRFALVYFCQIAIAALPLYWIIPHAIERIISAVSIDALLISIGPLIVGYWIIIYIIQLCFMYVQFGVMNNVSVFKTQLVFWRRIGPIIALSFMLLLISGMLASLNLSLTLVWPSFFSIVLHQLYYLTKSFMSIWEISAQYHIWDER